MPSATSSEPVPDSIPKSVLIVRLGAMGDVLHAMPAVAALRSVVPDARIGWVVEDRWATLLCSSVYPRFGVRGSQRPLVDAVHAVDTKRWRRNLLAKETVREVRQTLARIRLAGYEVALDVQGALKSAVIARLSRAEMRLGFASPRERAATLFYSRTVMAKGSHVVEQNVSLVSDLLGKPLAPAPFALPEDLAAETWCEKELASRKVRRFAILNPGAGWGAKQWPAERFAEVARALADSGLTCLVNLGPGEQELADEVALLSRGMAHTIACSIPELVALTRRAAIFVGGDTGPMHLAAALHVPVVALFGPTDPARNGPFDTASIVLRHESSNTSYSHRAQSDDGLMAITAAEVIAAARKLLGEAIG
jgi:heptosyltransferase-1